MNDFFLPALMTAGGLALLVASGEYLVKGAVNLARQLNVSPAFIGLTVVAFGTSAPELFVSVDAALSGVPGLAVGNVVGSNIANILLILGLTALVYPIRHDRGTLRRDSLALLGAVFLLLALGARGDVPTLAGVAMVALITVYLAYSYLRDARDDEISRHLHEEEAAEIRPMPGGLPAILAAVVLGLIGLFLGARLLVTGASDMARFFGVSDAVIGLTVVAVGTSLPELAASAVAARRKQADVALANVLGSNLMNILLILGLAGAVAPLPIDPKFMAIDLWVLLGATVVLLAVMDTKNGITRLTGCAFLATYAVYIMGQFLDLFPSGRSGL